MSLTSTPSSVATAEPPFSTDEFRSALGQFATGVTIVTARDAQGHLVGLTANSFSSVSLAPPLVLWCLSAKSSALAGFQSATHYAINVLAADQRLLAERFAKKGIDRFEGTPWRPGLTGSPVIDGAVAVFECSHHQWMEAGDHIVLVGRAEHVRRRVGANPLVFHGSRFFSDLST
ncbi:MAG: flavin reductase family protein [Aquabacterium sp.]|nr:flavin reductase family protein [Aquabacterium sp.]